MEEKTGAVPIVATALGNHVDDAARAVPKLGLEAGGEHLEFLNRVLVELRRRSPTELVPVRQSINQKDGVAASLAQHRGGGIRPLVLLLVDGYPGDQLHQVEIVASVERHVHNLCREYGGAEVRGVRLQQRNAGLHSHLLLQLSHRHFNVEGQDAVQQHFEFLVRSGGETAAGDRNRVGSRR